MKHFNSYVQAKKPRSNFYFQSGLFKVIVFFLLAQFLFYSCSKEKEKSLTIAVSANAQFAIKAIAEEYQKKNDIEIELIIGSSGKLTAQVFQGAPYDVFISADHVYPDIIHSKIVNSLSPVNYAQGSLVLCSSFLKEKLTMEVLRSEKVNKIAIANPEIAPYGRASVEMLKNLDLYEELKNKLIYGESISQCTQFIQSGAAQIGITAESVMHSESTSNEQNWMRIDTAFHSPMIQAFLILNPNKASIQFGDFVLSEAGQKILSDFGYFRSK